MRKTVCLKVIVLGFASLLLFGCGGGGGSDASRTPQPVVDDPTTPSEPVPMYVASGVGLDSAPSYLYTINPESGTIVSEIGKIVEESSGLEPAISDLAVTPGGLLYGCSYTTLYLIDKQTALAKPVGKFGVGGVNALAFNKTEGYLYGATTNGKILNINPNRPQDTVVLFQLANNYISSGDMVFAPDGTLYATLRLNLNWEEDDIVAIIDLENGSFQPLNQIGSGVKTIFGLSYFEGELYGVTAAREPESGAICHINLATGQATFVSYLPFSAFGSN